MFLKMALSAQANNIRAGITTTAGKGHDVMFMNSSEVRGAVAFLAKFPWDKKRELSFFSGLLLADAAKWRTFQFTPSNTERVKL
jgi:hypothetical protein